MSTPPFSFGKAKALVILRVPLSCLQSGSAPKLSDAHCIGLKIGQIWNGDTVSEALRAVFVQTGQPCAILKDGGSDLARGVTLLLKETPGISVLQDIGHITANLLVRSRGDIIPGRYRRTTVVAAYPAEPIVRISRTGLPMRYFIDGPV